MTPHQDPIELSCSSVWVHTPIVAHGLLIVFQDHIFSCLIDTGSDVSFIDTHIAHHLNIHTHPTTGEIGLASSVHSVPRAFCTEPLRFTPVLVHHTLQLLDPLSCSFELMEILRDQYQFIIGLDLIHSIFDRTKAIPLKYLPRVVETNPRTCSTTVTPPVSSIIHKPTASSSSISADAGSGGSPVEEQPIRVSTSTPPELQQQYSTERNRILTSHDIAAAITRNEAITGFCNLPEAVLKLKLDPH